MSEFLNKRPDSPKGQVWIAFQKKGEKAARAKAKALEIPEGRVNRWLKDEGAGFQGANDATKARKEKEAAPKKNGKAVAKSKKGKVPAKVHALADPEKRKRGRPAKKKKPTTRKPTQDEARAEA